MILMLISMIFMIILIFLAEHRIDRILQWWANAQTFILTFFPDFIANTLRVENVTEPYQIGHSLNAIHNGGFFGKMFGNGEFKYGFLTEVHTDFVLAGIAEEQGFLGILILSSLFLIIIHRIFKIANRVKNNVYYLFCIGIALLIGLSFIINAFGISGIIPIKGLAVPFISYGGSSMISYAIAIGMILSISKEIKSDKL
jgi:cell division protein FtsW